MPELPGCIAAGRSVAEVDQLIRGAIELHIAGLRERGDAVPPPTGSETTIVVLPSSS